MLLCWHFNFEISDLHVRVTIVNHLYDAKLINTYGTHTHTQPFNGAFSRTTQVSRYQKGKTNLDFTEARDSEWQ